MSDHDPFCVWTHEGQCHSCDTLAKVRADERERIAQAIEANPRYQFDSVREGMRLAARIARNGGRDG